MNPRTYIAIDLKSFFASVECVERGLDALSAHPVAVDAARTENTICLGSGKCAVLRGMDLLEGATTVARNGQIGGHKA